MAHEIEILNGEAKMMYVREGGMPWHGLGTAVDGAATADEVEKICFPWTVEKRRIFVEDEPGTFAPLREHVAVTRSDTPAPDNVLGVVSPKYQCIQNRDLFRVGDKLVGEGEAVYHTAGSLREGRKVWVLMRFPDDIEVTRDDIVQKFLLLTTSHDGSEAGRILFTPVRVVCNNTLSVAVRGAGLQARVLHAGDVRWQFDSAMELLGIVKHTYERSAEIYRDLARRTLTRAQVRELAESLFPDRTDDPKTRTRAKKRAGIEHLWEHGRGNGLPGVRGSAWAAFNAVTEYVEHCWLPTSGSEKRLHGTWMGRGRQIRETAWNKVRELAGV